MVLIEFFISQQKSGVTQQTTALLNSNQYFWF